MRERVHARNSLKHLLAAHNVQSPWKTPFGVRGLEWLGELEPPAVSALTRDELVDRARYFDSAISRVDAELSRVAEDFPETEAIIGIHGIGLYSALLIIAELGEPERFTNPKQVGAYTGLTSTVWQSGSREVRGSISHQGSPWLRWILVEAAMKVVRRDEALKRFYLRVKRRSGFKRARVAVARTLAEICWPEVRFRCGPAGPDGPGSVYAPGARSAARRRQAVATRAARTVGPFRGTGGSRRLAGRFSARLRSGARRRVRRRRRRYRAV